MLYDVIHYVSGYSNAEIFSIHNRTEWSYDPVWKGYNQGGDERIRKTETPFEAVVGSKNLGELWFKFSDPTDIRKYRSPVDIRFGYTTFKDIDTVLTIRFNNTYEITVWFDSEDGKYHHKTVLSGDLDKEAWDITPDEIEALILKHRNETADALRQLKEELVQAVA